MVETLLVVALLLLLLAAGTAALVQRGRRSGAVGEPPQPAPLRRVPVEQPEVAAPGAAEAPASAPAAPPEPEPTTVAPRLRDRLGKARSALAGYVGSILGRPAISAQTWDELEEALLRADVGVSLTTSLLDDLREADPPDPTSLLAGLKDALRSRLGSSGRELGRSTDEGRIPVWLFVGVNGVGKTTSIGKLAAREAREGRTALLAAGDTFRAAAAEQLEIWATRSGAEFVRGAEGADPSSVIFDAIQRAAARQLDIVLADTAGRLHTKVNLMEELSKVRRIADREPGQVVEVLLVIDATTGQNGLNQAKQFAEVAGVTGVVLTKLDSSARGGIVLAIQSELQIPVKLVGIGEGIEDLVEFDPEEFVEALFAAE